MPYKEVKLVLKRGSNMDQSIQLMDQPTASFHPHSRESLEFYFICDSRSTADILAENFKSYPAFVLQKWKLALECRRLADQDTGVPNTVTIDVSTLPQEIEHSGDIIVALIIQISSLKYFNFTFLQSRVALVTFAILS